MPRPSARRAAPQTFTIPPRTVSQPTWPCTQAGVDGAVWIARPPGPFGRVCRNKSAADPDFWSVVGETELRPVRSAGHEEARGRPQAAGQGLRGFAQTRDGYPDVGVGVRHGVPGVAELRESRDRQRESGSATSCSRDCGRSHTRKRVHDMLSELMKVRRATTITEVGGHHGNDRSRAVRRRRVVVVQPPVPARDARRAQRGDHDHVPRSSVSRAARRRVREPLFRRGRRGRYRSAWRHPRRGDRCSRVGTSAASCRSSSRWPV